VKPLIHVKDVDNCNSTTFFRNFTFNIKSCETIIKIMLNILPTENLGLFLVLYLCCQKIVMLN